MADNYYISAYSGEEIDQAVAIIMSLAESKPDITLAERLDDIESRIAALEEDTQ